MTPTKTPALRVSRLSKVFGDIQALKDVSFSVPEGKVLALLGPNGAGKTTLIDICEGFQKPTHGAVSVCGIDPVTRPQDVRAIIGIMLQESGSYSGIRVEEMLKLSASYNANPLDPDWLIELLGLGNVRSTTYRRLSGGQKQRLALALALISRPKVVFLDEPTAGLDAQSRVLVWRLIRQLRADGVTVILTTHLMDEAQALADEVVIIDQGSVVAAGSPSELRKEASPGLKFETDRDLDITAAPWAALGVEAIRPLVYSIPTEPTPALISQLARLAAEQNVLIISLSTEARSLEDIFLEITGRALRS
ncbi:ABC transporter ATP-binding protein [Corynebacterium sp. ES2794-CONJ1]|uniref:ABC transporter ATP-binding protein n=1 Tax=unclassified Corynebacterium TaxID=2624378 RepID=UPI00216826CC|nr:MULTISPECIES: ABC transporter ATP-binding protein [unclassified Corynebacterium]MCS4489297.1 ABC transporter ATP-binding protein [Corynebacterium sp. ES2775-CONJ]MCS4491110.1 ABC transporter ATP-binding protein [Corynebacterium sp. ES2715-CONJ3]MCU9518376.1 ABC transporter ATP-binding protein [Corynebacterium sp. ES2794-CONJ1]